MDEIGRIARAVLYEGYLLWPYRESALKNRHRWTIGGVHPEAYAGEHGDRRRVRAQCLLRAAETATVHVQVRFLHVVTRPREGGHGEEAGEREVSAPPFALGCGVPVRTEIGVPAGTDAGGRRWEALDGHVEVSAEALEPGLFRVTADIVNTTTWPGRDRPGAMARTFVSAHMVLHAPEGRFVSLMDPPDDLREHAEGCRGEGSWPVLVGDDLRTMLAAPIILYDHPKIAPESPGDLFDATEIDQLLTLSVLALGEDERREIAEGDPRAREIVDRCAALTEEELMRLHGVMRGTEPTA
ncbi:hypothetical protein [Spongiactinospora sp. TRM90649]|uniref:hypothetical protein n=1 Tax=Spongiactinospora sp. TRM90649 TaxID=3031114 RepID=UPI0023F6BF52|nr:hypothetical protein [Spongiactinospora sp. TRM90649]MDF5751746.1 hypothetical protein [Spongiactinospora sp. TRM90649]